MHGNSKFARTWSNLSDGDSTLIHKTFQLQRQIFFHKSSLKPHRLLQFIAHLVTDIYTQNSPVPHVENTFNKLNLEKINCATENESIKCEKMFAEWFSRASKLSFAFKWNSDAINQLAKRFGMNYERTEMISAKASNIPNPKSHQSLTLKSYRKPILTWTFASANLSIIHAAFPPFQRSPSTRSATQAIPDEFIAITPT